MSRRKGPSAILIHSLVFLFVAENKAVSSCDFPSVFQNSVWLDSTWSNVVFNTDQINGYAFTPYTTEVNSWECLKSDTFDTEGILIIRSLTTFISFTTNWYTYLCFKMTKVTDYSYAYQLMHPTQVNAHNYRAYINAVNTVTSQDEICDTTTFAPEEAFGLWIKNGSETAASMYCPSQILGVFDYTYTDTSGTPTCVGNTDYWDVCSDRMAMTFVNSDVSSCAIKMPLAAKENSSVRCLHYVEKDSITYTAIYNSDASVDGTNSFTFTCLAINSDGTQASLAPHRCRDGQTSNSHPFDAQAETDIGAILSMNARELCPFTTTSTEQSTVETTNAGAIAGGVVGGLIFIVLVIVGGILLWKFRPEIFKIFAIKSDEKTLKKREDPNTFELGIDNPSGVDISDELSDLEKSWKTEHKEMVFHLDSPSSSISPTDMPTPRVVTERSESIEEQLSPRVPGKTPGPQGPIKLLARETTLS